MNADLFREEKVRLSKSKERIPLLYNILSLLAFFVLWEILGQLGLINIKLLPPPSELYKEVFVEQRLEFFKLGYATRGSGFVIIYSIFSTLIRVLIGTVAGFSLGLFLGVLISYFKLFEYIFLPPIRLMAPISPIAWIPLTMVLFGVGNMPAIFVVFIGIFFLITIATVTSFGNVDSLFVKTARTLGASRKQTLFWVILPSVLPSIFLILRINVFAAWMSVLAAEMVGVSEGLGALVMVARSLFNVKLIFVGMILIGFTGYLLDQLLLLIQKKFLGWQKELVLNL